MGDTERTAAGSRPDGGNHANHRARLREKILGGMLSALAPHELLEAILCVPIARRDTNSLGHLLTERFSSVYGALHTDRDELVKLEGIGERTAEFLLDFGRAAEACERSRARERVTVSDPGTAESLVRAYFGSHPSEDAAVLGFDAVSRLIDIQPICPRFSVADIITVVVRMEAKSVIFAFRDRETDDDPPEHPESEGECVALITKGLSALGAEFRDYIVLSGDECRSYRRRMNPAGSYVERSAFEGRPVMHYRHGLPAKDYGARERAPKLPADILRMLSSDPNLAIELMSNEINRLCGDLWE